MKKLAIIIIALILIGSAIAFTVSDNPIKETSKYKVYDATLEEKEALHFEVKNKVSAKEIIVETIRIQEEKNEK